jgi:hypothetical protein
MVLIVGPRNLEEVNMFLESFGENSLDLGVLVPGSGVSVEFTIIFEHLLPWKSS